MSPNQILWEKDDFTAITPMMRESSEAVVNSLGFALLRMLDLG